MRHVLSRILSQALHCSVLAGLLFTPFLIAGCALKPLATGTNDAQSNPQTAFSEAYWAGRISLQIQSEPPQAFFAGFELKGRATQGELVLISPLGSTLAVMRWSPLEAILLQAGSSRNFASTDELLVQTTGAAVPLPALFDWLTGKNTPAPGWLADLSQLDNGRITAERSAPAPQATLRIVLDK